MSEVRYLPIRLSAQSPSDGADGEGELDRCHWSASSLTIICPVAGDDIGAIDARRFFPNGSILHPKLT